MSLDFALILTWYVVFVYSTVCHEAAHAWTARRLGDDTAYRGGQVSLDPIPHIRREPFGMVLVPLLMLFTSGRLIGWGSAPLDLQWVMQHPRRSAWVALAGPVSNFMLCLLALLLMYAGVQAGVFGRPAYYDRSGIVVGLGGSGWELAAQVVSVLFSLNLLLGVFNLLPVPPLDGSNLPLFWLRERSAVKYMEMVYQPQLQIFTLLIAILLFPRLYAHVELWSLRTLLRVLF